MKTKARFLAMFLALSCLLTVMVSAATAEDPSGLNHFPDIKSYQSGQFTDVPAGSWFENSVKTVYQKGLMDGIGKGRFAPYQVIPWSQAITLAARLHATYSGHEIADSEGPWYAKYIRYAEKAGILPSTCPAPAEVDAKPITRQELAGLFCNILSADDLPKINDKTIPDIDQVSPEFADSAKAMYAAGIFTGKSGNRFDPNGQAQRAEIATIMSRLLNPGTRIGHDSKANQAMVTQYGNFAYGGWAVMGSGVNYYTVRHYIGAGFDRVETYSIMSRTDEGVCSEVYSSNGVLSKLSLDANGRLYFVERHDEKYALNCMDLSAKSPQTVYQTKNGYVSIETYFLYEDELYILESDSAPADIENWKYTFGRLENGSLKSLFRSTYPLVSSMNESLHLFGGKAYFLYGTEKDMIGSSVFYDDAVWSLDLRTGEMEQVSGLVYSDLMACSGATCWYAASAGDGETIYLNRINLLRPDIVETMGILPEECMTLYWNMFANGGNLYYQSSGSRKLWRISESGAFSVAATMRTSHIDCSTVTNQGIVMHALSSISVLKPEDIDVLLPDGTRINYPEFLGMPTMYDGISRYELTDVTEYEPAFVEGKTSTCEIRRGLRADGDLVVEGTVKNQRDGGNDIGYYCIRIAGAGVALDRSFMSFDEISPGQTKDYTYVIPKELLNGLRPDELDIEIYLLVRDIP